ncbi:MAG: hypothetical protein QNJ07_06760 [Woeseiaceae bacterium]|nr:hypothetical protein [Woeseiaceae bacterium]
MSARRTLLTVCSITVCGLVLAADDELPEMEFLEYLGMWDESDEEWLVLEEPVAQNTETRNDPAPDSEESTEKDDES